MIKVKVFGSCGHFLNIITKLKKKTQKGQKYAIYVIYVGYFLLVLIYYSVLSVCRERALYSLKSFSKYEDAPSKMISNGNMLCLAKLIFFDLYFKIKLRDR